VAVEPPALAIATCHRAWRGGVRALVALVAGLVVVPGAGVPADAAAAAANKVLRYALRVAETGFDPAQISDLYSSTMAAMWGVAWTGGPDGNEPLVLGDGPAKGLTNHARFDLPEYNRLFQRQRVLPDGPERLEVMQRMNELMIAYMPYKAHLHRIWTDLAHPWVVGYHRNVFLREYWRHVDIDPAEKSRRLR
jgi:hypothetical protein